MLIKTLCPIKKFLLAVMNLAESWQPGHMEDQNCGLQFSKLFSCGSIIVEQSAIGDEVKTSLTDA